MPPSSRYKRARPDGESDPAKGLWSAAPPSLTSTSVIAPKTGLALSQADVHLGANSSKAIDNPGLGGIQKFDFATTAGSQAPETSASVSSQSLPMTESLCVATVPPSVVSALTSTKVSKPALSLAGLPSTFSSGPGGAMIVDAIISDP